jgi:hypothetical protein
VATVANHYGQGVQLILVNGFGNTIAADTDQSNGLQLSASGLPNGLYYIAVYSETPKPNETRSYELKVTSQQCFVGPNEQEPNNRASQANGPLCHGVIYRGLPNDDLDYFTFDTLTAGNISTTVADHFGEGAQLHLYYQTVSSTPVDTDVNDDDGLSVEYSNAPPGRYYILIYTETPRPAETRAYSMQVTFP